MGLILHDWNLDEKRMLLNMAYKALPEGGAGAVGRTGQGDGRAGGTTR